MKGLYKPPTHSELQSLKETQDLFSSNLMRLQVRAETAAALVLVRELCMVWTSVEPPLESG